ncbi:hypothetical protein Taro_046161 [Colocasia esculenta]|uniref:HECT-type E3 ubiquitin transferase n=1 Tax=Colocasia esculenta TaxID=4460 RepID=A0A843X589_COLES|nr:hypothetical protein [Colocasia esculenta]
MDSRARKRTEADEPQQVVRDKRACSSSGIRPGEAPSEEPPDAQAAAGPSPSFDRRTVDREMEFSSASSSSVRPESGSVDESSCSDGGEEDDDDDPDTGDDGGYHVGSRGAAVRYGCSMSGEKIKSVLSSLGQEAGVGAQLAALTELCEMLSFGSEDSLSSLVADSFAEALVRLAGHESNADIMLLAIRALAYLCDVLPRSATAIVKHGALPVLCGRLMSIEYLDVAEQGIQALEKISHNQPVPCLQAGAIMAVLTYIDFFTTSIQRVALSTVASMCKKFPSDCSSLVLEAIPTLCNLLHYDDGKIVETAAICLKRISENLGSSSDLLDDMCKHGLVKECASLIASASHGRSSLGQETYVDLIRLLSRLASGSLVAFRALLELNISSTLRGILETADISRSMSQSFRGNGHANQLRFPYQKLQKPPLELDGDVATEEDLQWVVRRFQEGRSYLGDIFGRNCLFVQVTLFSCSLPGREASPGWLQPPNPALLVHEVLKLLAQLIPSGSSEDKDIQLVLLKEKILVQEESKYLCQIGKDILPVLIQKAKLSFLIKCRSSVKFKGFRLSTCCQIFHSSTQVVNAGASPTICYGCVALIHSMVYLSSSEILLDLFRDINFSSFLAGLLSRKDIHVLHSSLKTAQILLEKQTDVFMGPFIKEGVVYAVDSLQLPDSHASPISDSGQVTVKDFSKCFCHVFNPSFSISRQAETCKIDKETVLALAMQIKSTYFNTVAEDIDKGLTDVLQKLRALCESLTDNAQKFSKDCYQNEEYLTGILKQIMEELGGGEPMSTFEFIESGITRSLAHYLSNGMYIQGQENDKCLQNHFSIVLKRFQTFASICLSKTGQNQDMLLKLLVQRLQNALSSLDQFPVVSSLGYKLRNVYADIPFGHSTMHPCLKVRFIPEDGSMLNGCYENVVAVKSSSSLDAIEEFLCRKISAKIGEESTEKGKDDSVSGGKCAEERIASEKHGKVIDEPQSLASSLLEVTINQELHLSQAADAGLTDGDLITRNVIINAFAEGRILDFDDLQLTMSAIPPLEFLSSKLTEKLEQQMRDPLSLSTGSMPPCSSRVQQKPLSPRDNSSNAINFTDNQRMQAGNFARKRFQVDRNHVLESATKVMSSHAHKEAILEVEFLEEVGIGLGPTLEFYTLVSCELQKIESTISSDEIQFNSVKHHFALLGKIVAKALQDGRILDLPLSKAFYKLMLDQELDVYDIRSFDHELGTTLLEFQALVCRRRFLESTSGNKETGHVSDLCYRGTRIEDLCLDFTLPGHPDYLLSSGNGSDMVNIINLEEYVSLVVDATIGSGISKQIEAFKSGFNEVLPLKALQIFTEDELEHLLCGEQNSWTFEELVDHIKFDHGYTGTSPPVISLLETIQEFECGQQRAFLQFVTGAPRLPPGGFAALNPKLTVVRKHCSEYADMELPSVMTCANYLKLPPYSCKEGILALMQENTVWHLD